VWKTRRHFSSTARSTAAAGEMPRLLDRAVMNTTVRGCRRPVHSGCATCLRVGRADTLRAPRLLVVVFFIKGGEATKTEKLGTHSGGAARAAGGPEFGGGMGTPAIGVRVVPYLLCCAAGRRRATSSEQRTR
jgi:hypothetical protein